VQLHGAFFICGRRRIGLKKQLFCGSSGMPLRFGARRARNPGICLLLAFYPPCCIGYGIPAVIEGALCCACAERHAGGKTRSSENSA